MTNYVIISINFVLIFFLLFPFVTIIFSILFRNKKSVGKIIKENDFACIITAYKNVAITQPLIDSLQKQDYKNYQIYLVADDCDLSEVDLSGTNTIILRPEKKLGSKVKSIIHAMNNFTRNHDALIIFDPDNVSHPNFLHEINRYFNLGYKAIQGKRIAKNLDNVYACLDATGEMYYNYTGKLVPYKIGSSANIAGSGMAIEVQAYKDYLNSKFIASNLDKVIVAEDKVLQNVLISKGIRIAFAPDALVFDEKVSSGQQVQRQRTRWINSYFQNIVESSKLIFLGVKNFNINQLLFGLFTIYPPLFILVFSTIFLLVFDMFFSPDMMMFLMASMAIFVLNFMLVLYLSKAPKEIWKSLWGIPVFIYFQVSALLRMKKANKDFMHTQHTKFVTIDHLMKKKQA